MNPSDEGMEEWPAAMVTIIEPVADENIVHDGASDASTVRQEQLQEPKQLERRLYYGRLSYKLVARTSVDSFDKDRTKKVGKREMQINPVGRYSHFSLFWNGRGRGSLQSGVRKALESLDVVKLEAVQMGFADEDSAEWPIVICATVAKKSAKWEEAINAALKVKEWLREWDIEDMECEIREDK